jgi:hypothetical protein
MAQTNPDPALKWEYPAGRNAERFELVKLDSVAREGGGLFGIRNSPSMADALDDPRVWSGTVAEGDRAGSPVHVRVPGPDVPEVKNGDLVALGIVEGHIVICVRKPPHDLDSAALRSWLGTQTCGS